MASAAGDRTSDRAWVRDPWAGLAFMVVVGSLWHFVYDASGRRWLVGLVAPVNESVWEHTKLIAIPVLLWAALVGWRTRRMPGSLVAGVVGGATGAALMLVGYYGYVAVLGRGSFPVDMLLFVLCSLAALTVFGRLRVRRTPAWTAAMLVALELAVFAVLTVSPPDWPMFVPEVR